MTIANFKDKEPIENGQVTFQTTEDPLKVIIRLNPAFKEGIARPEHREVDGKFLVHAGSEEDRQVAGFDQNKVAQRQRNWPPKIVFDLHRLVLAPWASAGRDDRAPGRRKRSRSSASPDESLPLKAAKLSKEASEDQMEGDGMDTYR